MEEQTQVSPGSRFTCMYKDDSFMKSGIIINYGFGNSKVLLDGRKRSTTLANQWMGDITPPNLMVGDTVVCTYQRDKSIHEKVGVILKYRGACLQYNDDIMNPMQPGNLYLVQFFDSKRKHVLSESLLKLI